MMDKKLLARHLDAFLDDAELAARVRRFAGARRVEADYHGPKTPTVTAIWHAQRTNDPTLAVRLWADGRPTVRRAIVPNPAFDVRLAFSKYEELKLERDAVLERIASGPLSELARRELLDPDTHTPLRARFCDRDDLHSDELARLAETPGLLHLLVRSQSVTRLPPAITSTLDVSSIFQLLFRNDLASFDREFRHALFSAYLAYRRNANVPDSYFPPPYRNLFDSAWLDAHEAATLAAVLAHFFTTDMSRWHYQLVEVSACAQLLAENESVPPEAFESWSVEWCPAATARAIAHRCHDAESMETAMHLAIDWDGTIGDLISSANLVAASTTAAPTCGVAEPEPSSAPGPETERPQVEQTALALV